MLSVARGTCYSIFVYDVAFAINLEGAERLTSATRETIKRKRQAPQYFEYHPAPLRVVQAGPVHVDGVLPTDKSVELVLYDFGAVVVIYRIPLDQSSDLLALGQQLYENKNLLDDSLKRVQGLLNVIANAVSKPNVSSFVEDYVMFHVEAFGDSASIEDLTGIHAQHVARILRAESRELSEDEVRDAVSHRISYGKDDVVIVDWNAALIVDKEPDDVLRVLEFANVELLEMRFLDQRLDAALGQAHDRLSKRSQKWFRFPSDPSDLRDISQWQVDSAILFEVVNNVLKLLGDQYLARLYRLGAQRFHLSEWDGTILRKLQTLESIYQKVSNEVTTRRMEVLEWIIIILIVISIVLPFISPNLH